MKKKQSLKKQINVESDPALYRQFKARCVMYGTTVSAVFTDQMKAYLMAHPVQNMQVGKL